MRPRPILSALRRAFLHASHPARVARRKARRAATLARRKLTQGMIEPRVRIHLVPRTVIHLHGPVRIAYAPDELLVLCVVRNGELYVRSFIDHYRSLGAKHLVFLDNGSTDNTVQLLREHDVTVLQSRAPYQQYETPFRLYLLRRFSSGRWSLTADIDELFDYPYSHAIELRDFLSYLNEYRYTAVLAQMLDMFAPVALSEVRSRAEESVVHKYTHYDLSSIRKVTYTWPGMSNPDIKWHFVGVRGRVFGTNNSLTKASLLYGDAKLRPFVSFHHVKGARIADVSCLLRHYPFVESFRSKVEEAVQTKRYTGATWEYSAYWRSLEHDPDVNLVGASTRQLGSVDELIEKNFLIVSEAYRQWVAAHARLLPA
jgi:glycosyltransferase involved in cell wall biosynthesis